MKIKNRILIGAFSLLLVGGTSCSKFLDINTSPLTATEVDPNLLFGYAVTAWDVNKNGGDAWIPIGMFIQNMASAGDYGWGKENLYDLSVFTTGNTWKMFYSTGGNNLNAAIQIAESANPVNNNAAAQCKIVKAQLLYEATVLYGDVPFAEAWNPVEFSHPKYDPQKDVFEGIIALLDEAIAQVDLASSFKIAAYDIYYKGDMAKWVKLAKSLKFRVLMTMVDKDPSKAEAIGQLLSNSDSMISSPADSWLHPYYNKTDNENPKFRVFKRFSNSQNPYFFANNNVFNYMEPLNDPRIPKYFDLPPAIKDKDGNIIFQQETYKGVDTEVDGDSTISRISMYLYRADAPSVIFSYQEILLLEAEAYARGLGVGKDLVKAQDLYKKGVEAAMKFYEADPDAIAVYLAQSLPNLTTSADPLYEIHIQQWIDLMDRPLEAFVQWRRSGPDGSEVPTLTLPPGATAGPLIRRFTLSPEEVAVNPNVPSPAPKYYDKMWFDL